MTATLFTAPARRVDRVFLHCSASEADLAGEALVDEIRRWHLARKFRDIGYHFVIDREGAVLPGRPLAQTPAAQRGHNRGTIAICAHGLKTFPQINAVHALCREINIALKGRVSFHGHCEVSNKTCPVFDYEKLLMLDRFGRMP